MPSSSKNHSIRGTSGALDSPKRDLDSPKRDIDTLAPSSDQPRRPPRMLWFSRRTGHSHRPRRQSRRSVRTASAVLRWRGTALYQIATSTRSGPDTTQEREERGQSYPWKPVEGDSTVLPMVLLRQRERGSPVSERGSPSSGYCRGVSAVVVSVGSQPRSNPWRSKRRETNGSRVPGA